MPAVVLSICLQGVETLPVSQCGSQCFPGGSPFTAAQVMRRYQGYVDCEQCCNPMCTYLCRAVFPETPPSTSPEDRASFSPRLGGPSGSHGSLGSLATYDLPKPRQKQRWLDETIRKAVLNIGEAPFLQATSTDPHPQLRRFHVAPAIGSAPQVGCKASMQQKL